MMELKEKRETKLKKGTGVTVQMLETMQSLGVWAWTGSWIQELSVQT